jgi:mannan polymerase II complex MNN10 subunit
VRGHARSLDFLHSIYAAEKKEKEAEPDRQISEQDAMAWLIESDKTFGDRTVRVPQWRLNAFPPEIPCYDEPGQVWKPGMFVLHFAGAWAHVKGEDPTGQLMKKYEGDIVWGDSKEFY